jgi:hypothetical protein
MTIIFSYFLSIATCDNDLVRRLQAGALLRGIACTLAATAVIAVPCLVLYPAGPLWLATGELLLATLGAFGIFKLAGAEPADDVHGWIKRQRLRMAVSVGAAGVVFLAQLI